MSTSPSAREWAMRSPRRPQRDTLAIWPQSGPMRLGGWQSGRATAARPVRPTNYRFAQDNVWQVECWFSQINDLQAAELTLDPC